MARRGRREQWRPNWASTPTRSSPSSRSVGGRALVMTDITTTDDVAWLVRRFYRVAIPDPVLGPIFDAAHMEWDVHIPRITAFWERQLLDLPGYHGNMVRVHVETHDRTPLGDREFARWLELW